MHTKQTAPRGNAGLRQAGLTADISSANNAANLGRQRLDLFGARCHELAERVTLGTITFVDAVDMAYSAAVWSGLADDLGDDAVQRVMASAFMGVRR
jgi:hypothetical protein